MPYGGVDLKQRQLDSLMKARISNGRVLSPSPGRSYIVEFRAGSLEMKLIIAIPHNFPQVPPQISVAPHTVSHPWINSTHHLTGCSELNQWCATSSLGTIVEKVVSHFQRNQPRSGAFSARPTSHSFSHSSSDKHFSLPKAAELVEHLSEEELKKLENPAHLNEFVAEYVRDMDRAVEAKRREVVDLATLNLSYESELVRKRDELKELASEVLSLTSSVEGSLGKQQQFADNFLPDNVLMQLQVNSETAASESTKIYRECKNGDMNAKTFAKEYLKAKKIEHERKLKASLYQQNM
eukprot:m.22840 g.22840  ORF g.22840 m.22840 type:complete len:295 (+) comp8901_c0_seq1:93-977(+)